MDICPKIALNLKLTIVVEKNFNMILVSEGILLQDHKIILLYVTLYLRLTQNYYELLLFEIHTSEYFQSTKKIDKSHIPNCILGHNLSMFPLFGTKMCLPFNFRRWNYNSNIIYKGAKLTSATGPWHWLFFCPAPKVSTVVSTYIGRPEKIPRNPGVALVVFTPRSAPIII